MFLQDFVRRVRRGVVVPLCLALLTSTVAPSVLAASGPKAERRYSGVTLVRGLIFADGPVADRLEPIRDHLRLSNFVTDKDQLQQVRQMHARVLAAIAQQNPRFFDRFRAAMESGDHLRIDASLKESAALVFRALASLPEYQEARRQAQVQPEEILREYVERTGTTDPEQLARVRTMIEAVAEGEEPGDGSGDLSPTIAAIVLGVYFALAVHNIVVLTAGVYVYFGYDVGFSVVPPTEEAPSLLHEQLVDAVATGLARNSR